MPGSSEPETEAIHADTPNDDNICKECNVPATIKRFRREGGRVSLLLCYPSPDGHLFI